MMFSTHNALLVVYLISWLLSQVLGYLALSRGLDAGLACVMPIESQLYFPASTAILALFFLSLIAVFAKSQFALALFAFYWLCYLAYVFVFGNLSLVGLSGATHMIHVLAAGAILVTISNEERRGAGDVTRPD